MGHPVYAAADGVVTETECDGSVGVGDISGNCGGVGRIIIKHTINVGGVQKNIYTWSLHLSKGLYQDNKTVVKKGDRVTSGQQIGLSGATGAGTAYHLHFEVRVGCGAESVRASATVANCSSRPSADTMGASVDPFGWTGPGSDPLASSNGFQYWYQAEGFVPRLLWK